LISAKIIDGLQTIISRESDLTNEAAVITVGKITAGVRFNIIPETAEMVGTIRTLDYKMRDHIGKRMKEMVSAIAAAYGGTATVDIVNGAAITYNDANLVGQMLPTLQKTAGKEQVMLKKAITGAEKVPGFYFFLGGNTPGNKEAFPHHTPDFKIDDAGMLLGVKTLSEMALDYLSH
jgi:metal-dependent amidase/aminoacylase/carboxypeptidase family protein